MSPPDMQTDDQPTRNSTRKFRVLVTDDVDDSGLSILQTIAVVDKKVGLTEAEIVEAIPHYHALMVRSATKVTEKIIKAGTGLKIIGRAGVGVDNVDVPAATHAGVYVVNSPLGNIVAAAEHTLALMLSSARMVPRADASIRSGKWERSKFVGSQLQDKTLGIVGLGQVGSHVARVAKEMGMRLMVHDPYVNQQKADFLKCQVVSLDTLLRQSDFVTLHVPKLDATEKLINEERLSIMKPTARIINTSRGGVIDEVALANALSKGTLGGAALDVFESEKAFPEGHPLLAAPNIVLTPHLGASTEEAQINVAVDVAHQILDTLLGSLPQSAVNLPGLRPADLKDLRPVLNVCTTLGRIAAQLLKGPLEDITVMAEGSYAEGNLDALLLATAYGAIGVHLAAPVNFVNVRQVADRYKIGTKVSAVAGKLKATVNVHLRSSLSTAEVRGTVSEDGGVLLKSFQGVPILMKLPQTDDAAVHMFYSKHSDQPGALGKITSCLGESGYNIANCHLGRTTDESGDSFGICIFHIDDAVNVDIVSRIESLEGVKEARCLAV